MMLGVQSMSRVPNILGGCSIQLWLANLEFHTIDQCGSKKRALSLLVPFQWISWWRTKYFHYQKIKFMLSFKEHFH